MKKILNYITLLTALCLAGISYAEDNEKSESDISISLGIERLSDGSAKLNILEWKGHHDEKISTDEQRDFFFGSDYNIKRAIGVYFGKRPDDVYYSDEKNTHHMFDKYRWERPTIRTKIEKIELLDFEPNRLYVIGYRHNASRTTTTEENKVLMRFENRVQSSFSNTQALSFDQTISADFKVFGFGVSSTTSLGANFTFNQSGQQESKEILEITTTTRIPETKKQRSYRLSTIANYGKGKIRITYKQYVIGGFAINYRDTYKGNHYYHMPIENFHQYLDEDKYKRSYQDIEVDLYADIETLVEEFPYNPGLKASSNNYEGSPVEFKSVTTIDK